MTWNAYFPHSPEDLDLAPWLALFPELHDLKNVQQEYAFHGEGDAWIHTRLVVRALLEDECYWHLPRRQREVLFLAALLHDIGKIPCTRREGSAWVSPGHSRTGARMARELLWTRLGLSGSREAQSFREAVCGLIRWHMVPPNLFHRKNQDRLLFEMAALGELTEDFSLELLEILARADQKGRQSVDVPFRLEDIQLCFDLARELGIEKGPYPFPTPAARYSYLSGRTSHVTTPAYDSSWGTITMLCGLPGTGKDTWIAQNRPSLPVISLDNIRLEMGIPPTGNQRPVIEEARQRAKILLRQKQHFVWNATCINTSLREKQLRLFRDYGAAAEIVFLETPWQENLRRNRSRTAEVPEAAICKMLHKLEPPTPAEARDIRWEIV